MIRRIRYIVDSIRQSVQTPFFGFVRGHDYLRQNDLQQIEKLVGVQAIDVVAEYERRFAKLVGRGEAISYAAARMGFYCLMRAMNIGKNDEVILQGATCAVMVNAVMRTGATPIFSDVDPNSFGSSSKAIGGCITQKTRMIVAQHSFGIPCDIESIVTVAKENEIFLLEDCACALDSKVNGISVGNFGDAAIFSTDHSKPINTICGGLVYTCNSELANRLRLAQANYFELSLQRQQALWRRFLLEKNFCTPETFGRLKLLDLLGAFWRNFTKSESAFLSDDFGKNPSTTYPYPARLPAFLAAIGILELDRWVMVATDREAILKYLLDELVNSPLKFHLPSAYKDKSLQIVPLRLAWSQSNGAEIRDSLRHFVDTDHFWFLEPIIARRDSHETFGYRPGSCPISENLCTGMLNIPCNIDRKDATTLIQMFREVCK